MMTSMIERVARAIYFRGGEHDEKAWQYVQDGKREVVYEQARAAIEAMREPSEAMHDGARDWSRVLYGKPIGYAASGGCYRAMIDAALEESADQ
jgi:hypothetical protein